MKQDSIFNWATVYLALFLATGCNPSTAEKTTDAKHETAQEMSTKADPAQLKAEIQDQETAWAAADNARDVNTVAAFYSDDAVSMSNNAPMVVGNAAIKKD